MIRTNWIAKFHRPVAYDAIMHEVVEQFSGGIQCVESRIIISCSLFNAYLNAVGRVLDDGLDKKVLDEFQGFLVRDTNIKSVAMPRVISDVLLLVEHINEVELCVEYYYHPDLNGKCVGQYEATNPCRTILKFYGGWPLACSDGRVKNANLQDYYHQFGELECDKYYEKLRKFFKTMRSSTAGNKLKSVHRITRHLCRCFPTVKDLEALQVPSEVNIFVEYIYELDLAHYVVKKGKDLDVHAQNKEWRQTLVLIEEFYVRRRIFGLPQYSLHQGKGRRGLASLVQEGRKTEKLIPLLTPVPLAITDDAALSLLGEQINASVHLLKDACEAARRETLNGIAWRNEQALSGRISQFSDIRESRQNINNQCRTWQEHTYDLYDKNIRYQLLGGNSGIDSRLALPTNSTLLPFLYLIVCEHPQVSISWLCSLTVVNNYGQDTGVTADGDVVISDKARKGPGAAEQYIVPNERSKLLFKEILAITEEMREFLKKTGDDDYRYLLLGSERGIGHPKHINRITPLNSKRYENSKLVEVIRRDGEKYGTLDVRRITLKTVRATTAVCVYLRTGSVRKMSEALGHEVYVSYLIRHYLPNQIREFFLDRWIRIFQTALTYEAMKDREYMFEAVGINNLDELHMFLINHGLKPLPMHLQNGALDIIPKAIAPSYRGKRVIMPISSTLCSVLITIADVVDKLQLAGKNVCDVAKHWYQTAWYLRAAVNLHESNQISVCSKEAVQIFRTAKPSAFLEKQLEQWCQN